MLAVAKIAAKGQTAIPQAARAALGVSSRDLIAVEVGDDGTAMVRQVRPMDIEHPRAARSVPDLQLDNPAMERN